MNSSESKLLCKTLEIDFFDTSKKETYKTKLKLFKIELPKYHGIAYLLTKILIPAEVKRAERYRHIKDRNRFIICRSMLKYVLAVETGSEISKITFETHDNKKPYLPSHPSVFFNVAHAGDYALIALGNCDLGVDVEFINTNFDFEEILPTVFSDAEIDTLANSTDKHYTFYKLWTRKEAIVKATGKGIDDNLCKIPVTEGLHIVPSSLLSDFKTLNALSFHISPDYVGSLAITESIDNFEAIKFYPLPEPDELKVFLKTI